MTIDRMRWKAPFNIWPVWPCPNCGNTALSLRKESLVALETGPSRQAHGEQAWEIAWMDERFTAQLVCGNPTCGNVVVVCGRVQNEEEMYYDEKGRTQSTVVPFYVPFYFQDPLPIFPIAAECPQAVREEIQKSFALFWCDVSSAGNRVRAAVEALLTERGVARTVINSKGKRKSLTLHSRIDKFKAKQADAANTLYAIKWLGNDGSHAGTEGLDTDDLLDAYELFEHAIDQVYVQRGRRMARLASGINKKRGSVRRKAKDKSPWA